MAAPPAAAPAAAPAPSAVRAEHSVPKLSEKPKKVNPNSILGYEYEVRCRGACAARDRGPSV